jgi:hypothetical protein
MVVVVRTSSSVGSQFVSRTIGALRLMPHLAAEAPLASTPTIAARRAPFRPGISDRNKHLTPYPFNPGCLLVGQASAISLLIKSRLAGTSFRRGLGWATAIRLSMGAGGRGAGRGRGRPAGEQRVRGALVNSLVPGAIKSAFSKDACPEPWLEPLHLYGQSLS